MFHYPNQITEHDFDGWVQERGLYFADSWDGNFKPLLSSHDPGESPLKGGLLRAQYGKGHIYLRRICFFSSAAGGRAGSDSACT